MIVTEKRIAANRANAALSTGPKTPEGKARSSQNATTHGLLANVVTLKNENKAGFEVSVQSYVDRFKPTDDVETDLVYQFAATSWRIRRGLAIEAQMINAEMDNRPVAPSEIDRTTSAFGDLCKDPKMSLLHRYQHRLSTLQSRLLRDLAYLRSKFPGDEAPAPTPVAEPEPVADEPRPSQASTSKILPNEPTKPFPIIKTTPPIEPIKGDRASGRTAPFDPAALK